MKLSSEERLWPEAGLPIYRTTFMSDHFVEGDNEGGAVEFWTAVIVLDGPLEPDGSFTLGRGPLVKQMERLLEGGGRLGTLNVAMVSEDIKLDELEQAIHAVFEKAVPGDGLLFIATAPGLEDRVRAVLFGKGGHGPPD